MSPILILMTIFIFLFGIVIGSFLNVCIYRIPKGEDIVKTSSHCMSCGYQLRWYDLIPLFSYIFLRGKCRKCGVKLSMQYPIVEALNGILYVLIFYVTDFTVDSFIFCLMTSALLVLAVIDFRTYEIPWGINLLLFVLGVVRCMSDKENLMDHLIGFVAVSGVLLLIYIFSKGAAIGGGDIKLMAATGLLLNWKLIIFAFILGCVIGSVIHLIRMKFFHAGRMLAMGPYLSAGIFIAALWGDTLIDGYLNLLGI
ncbi:MAG: prepilin peptidase [Lachnospiraceae bacterium]|nr:prepilin peptidase [Lachnospiraceae bacterium]